MRRTLSTATVLVALTAGVGVAGGPANAAVTDLFVNNTVACSDAGTGSQTLPFCTLSAATAAVVGGQTVRVTGTYNERVTIAKSGTEGSPVTFRPGGTEHDAAWSLSGVAAGVTIDGQHDVTVLGVQISGSLNGPAILMAHSTRVVVEQSKVDTSGPGAGVRLESVTESSLSKSRIVGNMSPAISLDAATNGFTVADVHINSGPGGRPGGIRVLGSNNTVLHSSINGTEGSAVTVAAGALGNVVAGNIIDAVRGAGIDNAGATGTAIANNLAFSNCGPGIRVSGASAGVSVQNNEVFDNGVSGCGSGFTDKAGISVSDEAVPGTVVDYNTVKASGSNPPYAWKVPLASLEAFRAASNQGAHDLTYTDDESRRNVNIDSGNADAPGRPVLDLYGHGAEDHPEVANTGTGPIGYVDRGPVEKVAGPGASLTLLQRPGGAVVADASESRAGWVPIVSYTFDFGDGTVVTQASPIANHNYATRATRRVMVTVKDANGLTAWYDRQFVPGDAYVPVGPVRVLDTREAIGTGRTPVAPGGTLTLTVAGANGVPATGVTSATMNVTVTGSTAGGFLTVYPNGQTRPTASNLNWTPGLTVPNLVVVSVVNGKVDFYNASSGTVHVIADLVGYHSTGLGSGLVPLGPLRVLDTREAVGTPGRTPVAPGGTLTLSVAGALGIPPTIAKAVTMNVTVTEPTTGGYLTVYPNGQARPTASNLNWTPGLTVPNLVVVPVVNGKVDFRNASSGTVHVIADVVGYYSAGGEVFRPRGPYRALDSRAAIGTTGTTPLLPGSWFELDLKGLTAEGATSVVLNVTVTEPTGAGFLTVYGDFGKPRPTASNLNWRAGQTVPNLVVVPLHPTTGTALFYNGSGGTVHVIADVVGFYGN